MGIARFEDITAWQRARELTSAVYVLSSKESFARDFGLRDQIRSAAGSVMHNIAEGFDAGSDPEFVRFLGYGRRSATEVQSQLYVALDQSYITQAQFDHLFDLAEQCKKLITAFINYLRHHTKP